MALRYKCYKCLTLWSAADVGGVADGSLCHRTAAALYPQSCRGYENTAGLRFVRAGSLLRLRYGGLIVKSGSIRPFVVSAGNLHEGSSHELHLKQMNWEKKKILLRLWFCETRTSWLERPIQSGKPSVLAMSFICALCWMSWILATCPPRWPHSFRAWYQFNFCVRTW